MKKMNKLDNLLINVGDMSLKRRAKLIIEELELQKGDRVLDIGCGDGFYLHLLSNLDLSLKLTGFDISKDSLKTAKGNLMNKKIKLIQGDLMDRLPFADSSFDKIIMSEVLEHLPDDQKGLKEVYRILKSNGILCMTVPNANYPMLWDPINWLLENIFKTHIKSGFWAGIWNQHLRLYDLDNLKKILLKANFEIGRIEGVTFWCLPFNHYLVNFAARLFYSHSLNKELSSDMSKFNTSMKKNTSIASLAFYTVNLVDKLNDLIPIPEGVSILSKLRKNKIT